MKKEDTYQPINCEVHDGYELACMRRAVHGVTWIDGEDTVTELLRFLDLKYAEGNEFLIAETQSGERRSIRLDKITSNLPY